VLERHLVGRHYVVGDDITIADYSMIPFESYRPAVPFDWSPHPNINAYFDRVRKVEHWVRTAPASSASFGLRETALARANA